MLTNKWQSRTILLITGKETKGHTHFGKIHNDFKKFNIKFKISAHKLFGPLCFNQQQPPAGKTVVGESLENY